MDQAGTRGVAETPEEILRRFVGGPSGAAAARRLLAFLEGLRSGSFAAWTPLRKQRALETYSCLRAGLGKERVLEACRAFFSEPWAGDALALHLPAAMTEALLAAARKERFRALKEQMWEIILRDGAGLSLSLDAADLAFGLRCENPVLRNTLLRAVLKQGNARAILESYLAKDDLQVGSISWAALERLFGFMPRREASLRRREWLERRGGLPGARGGDQDALPEPRFLNWTRFDRIWALHRFPGTPIFRGAGDPLQTGFSFINPRSPLSPRTPWCRRIRAIGEAKRKKVRRCPGPQGHVSPRLRLVARHALEAGPGRNGLGPISHCLSPTT